MTDESIRQEEVNNSETQSDQGASPHSEGDDALGNDLPVVEADSAQLVGQGSGISVFSRGGCRC